MKWFLSALLIFCLIITTLPTGALAAASAELSVPGLSTLEYTTADLQSLPAVPEFDFEFLTPSEKWKTLAEGDAPAAFSAIQNKSPEKIIHEGGSTGRVFPHLPSW